MQLTAAVAELPLPAGTPPAARQFTDLEVAVALGVAPATGAAHQARARYAVANLPLTMSRFTQGLIGEYHLIRLRELTRTERAEALLSICEAEIWAKAGETPTAPQLARTARRVMARHDRFTFLTTTIDARRRADVRLRVEPDTAMGWITGYLPLLDAVNVMNAITARAQAAKATGAAEPLSQLRAVALRDLAEDYLSGPKAPRRHGRPVEVHVLATLDTVLGLTNTPPELPGYGPLPATILTELATDAKHRLLITNQHGQLLDYGRRAYRPPTDLAAQIIASYQTSAAPGCTTPADQCDLDHWKPFDTGGRTGPTNLIPLDRRHHRAKTLGGWSYTLNPDGQITWTTALGQTTTTQPFDYRLGP